MSNPQEFIKEMFHRGLLLNKEILEKEVDSSLLQKIELEGDLIILNEDYLDLIKQHSCLIDWYDLDQYRVSWEKDHDSDLYHNQLQYFKHSTLSVIHSTINKDSSIQLLSSLETELTLEQPQSSITTTSFDVLHSPESVSSSLFIDSVATAVTVVLCYNNQPVKYSLDNFTNFFLTRHRFLESILRDHQELKNLTSINRILGKREKENVSIIAIINDIGETKNGNVVVDVEDQTGKIKVIFSKIKKGLYTQAKDLVLDEVIGINGISGDKIVFAESVVWPDVPHNELKKGPEEEYVAFLSDIHVGSKLFLQKEFERFLRWINAEAGNEQQRDIAKKVRYIIIAGDLVDGVGVYPSQEEELAIKNIREQYSEFVKLIGRIPKDKQIIMCPGNHDMVYLAEPQPLLYQEFAPGLFSLPNVTLVTNPSIINIGKKENFSGFDILLYHGYSFDYYVANVESIRVGGGYHRADLIMKFLLKRRHLAPSFRSTPYFPAHKEDPLLIKRVPDFFITGHIHYSSVANYKNITMISGSCWQDKTTFQEKLGHKPEPARVPIVNLKTRDVKVLRFG